MSDGCEERAEREMRIEQKKRENREGRVDRDDIDPDAIAEWEPERFDSNAQEIVRRKVYTFSHRNA